MCDISDMQLHQITGPELAVYGKVKQCELAGLLRELEPNADGPDILEPKRRFLPDKFALVPGLAGGHNPKTLIHDTSPE
jgi:hypothetical protein